MTVKSLAGFAGIASVALLGACAQEEAAVVAISEQPTAVVCEPLPGVYARVADMRPVNYAGAFEPGFIAVTDTTQIGAGQPNAVQYVVVSEDNRQLPLIAREQYAVGDQLYIEADTCERARVTVIQELG